MKAVLILEDDLSLAKSLSREFEDHGYKPTVIHSIKQIPNQEFQFALVDLRLNSGEMGLDALQIILKKSPHCQIVVLSGYGSIATAVEAVKRGARDYLTKPASFTQIENALLGQRQLAETEFERPSLSQVEHEYIDFVLTKNQGNISKTAKDLGLHRQSLQRKLKKYT
jgi:Response regulator consisting of a CheY-like receiver domain and a Fis-type HTH domain